jgi:hypothetical protein
MLSQGSNNKSSQSMKDLEELFAKFMVKDPIKKKVAKAEKAVKAVKAATGLVKVKRSAALKNSIKSTATQHMISALTDIYDNPRNLRDEVNRRSKRVKDNKLAKASKVKSELPAAPKPKRQRVSSPKVSIRISPLHESQKSDN